MQEKILSIFRSRFWWLAALIFLLGVALRFYQLGNVPPVLNRDEASLGYTAYSILKTGHEEHGQYFPLSIESFGDWKLPGYVYTLIPVIWVGGLKPWAVRLPSALAGSLSIILAGVLVYQFGSNLKSKKRQLLTLLTIFLVSISPWGIHLSHRAYEANLAQFFFLLGFNLIWAGLQKIELKLQKWFIPLGVFFLGLTLFTYHSYHVFTPLMALGLLLIFKNEWLKLWQNRKYVFIVTAAITSIMVLVLAGTSLAANQTKFSGLSIFEPQAYGEYIFKDRALFADKPQLLAKIYTNSWTSIIDQLQRNIFTLYSGQFLFFEGGSHGSHDIPHTGKLYPFEFLTLSITLIVIISQLAQGKLKNKKGPVLDSWQKTALWWLAAASVAPIITFEAAHSIRFSPALPILNILSAYGLWHLITWLKQRKKYLKYLGFLTLVGVICYSLTFFVIHYFWVVPHKYLDLYNWQTPKLAELIAQKKNNYDKVFVNDYSWSPYIYLLFEWEYPPQELLQEIEYLPLDHEGFKHVKRLENIYFEDGDDWQKREEREESILYIAPQDQIPGDKFNHPYYHIEYLLTNPDSQQTWVFLSYDKK